VTGPRLRGWTDFRWTGLQGSYRVGIAVCVLWMAVWASLPLPQLRADELRADEPQSETSTTTTAQLDVTDLTIGFRGTIKVGEWAPLRLTVTVSQPVQVRVLVEAPDPDDSLAVFPSRLFRLVPGEPQLLETTFKTGRMQAGLRIRIVDEAQQPLFERRLRPSTDPQAVFHPPILLQRPLWVVLDEASAFPIDLLQGKPTTDTPASTGDTTAAPARLPVDFVRLTSSGELYSTPGCYQTIDVLLMMTGSLKADLNEEQSAALEHWVRGGGAVILSVGKRAEAFRQSTLAKWVPVPITGTAPLRRLTGLEVYLGRSQPLNFPGALTGAQFGTLDERQVLVRELEQPLLVRSPYGFGSVTVFGVDLDRPPLSTWKSLPALFEKIVGHAVSSPRLGRQTTQLSNLGITDLASQLEAAQEDFGPVRRVSYWWVMGLVFLYILVIGPLDYVVVHRWLKRPELTWITFPLLVALGAGTSVWGAARWKGDQVLVNQVNIIDIDGGTHLVRGNTWVTLYSDQSRRYQIQVTPTDEIQPESAGATRPQSSPQLSWFGVPEKSIGGLYRTGGLSISGRSYQFAPEAASVENIPVLQWSTRSLRASWQQAGHELVVSQLSGSENRLTGTVLHNLPVPLQGLMLVYSGRVYFPNSDKFALAPGIEWEPAGSFNRQRELKALLTGTRAERVKSQRKLDSEIQFRTEPYDPLSHHLGDLVRMLSFHEAAGGSTYTGLNHTALDELELVSQMQMGQAVMIARLDLTAATVELDGTAVEPSHRETFVRFVLPVRQMEGGRIMSIPNPEKILNKTP